MDTTLASVDRQTDKTEKRIHDGNLIILLIAALCTDLLTPFLIWKGFLPASVRWISHGAIALMILSSFARMIVFNKIPRVFWIIPGVSAIWAFVAVIKGQGIVPTIWGLWLLFQFPFVAMFMYLQPAWLPRFSYKIKIFALACLALEVAVQFVQYFLGETPGDNLAGMFGKNGTGNLVIFIFLVYCLFLGNWITNKRWFGMIVAAGLGLISSVLGEMKFFTVGFLALSSFALVIYAVKNRTFWRLAIYSVLIIAALYTFENLYNRFVPGASRVPFMEYINDPKYLQKYLNSTEAYYSDGIYIIDLGRNAALVVGWNSLKTDPVTMLFGWGIGTRSESLTLGTVGQGIQLGDLGRTTGTGLLIFMQEMGLVGLVTLAGFFLWIILRLSKDIRRNPSSDAVDLRYAIILFTCFWPVWLWYSTAWTLRVPMLLYWMLLGYVLWEARQPVVSALKSNEK